MIAENIHRIRQHIDNVAKNCGRNPGDIRLMAVSKTIDTATICQAINAGIDLLGENRVQEICAKIPALSGLNYEMHLIGQLQTNKAKMVVDKVSCIQSLDRERLALKLQEELEKADHSLDVLIQVNTSYEESKSGVAPECAIDFISKIYEYDRLRIQGLMTIGAHSDDEQLVRQSFRLLKEIQEKARDRFSHRASFDVLSMGMSGDWQIAVQEGATLLRLGSVIFGQRQG